MFGRPPVRVAFFVYLQDERFVHVGVVLSKWGGRLATWPAEVGAPTDGFVLTIGKIILRYSANFVMQPVNSVSLFGLSVSRLKNPVSRSVTTNGRIVVRP